MNKTANSRTLTYLCTLLALCVAIFVANIVIPNLFAIIVNILIMMLICLAIGYTYSKFEREPKSKSKNTTSCECMEKDVQSSTTITPNLAEEFNDI